MTFQNFFQTAIGKPPYAWQERLAEESCASRLITIPTGLGKTAGAILAWLWNRPHKQSNDWSCRLAYFEAIFRAADNRASILVKSTNGGETHA